MKKSIYNNKRRGITTTTNEVWDKKSGKFLDKLLEEGTDTEVIENIQESISSLQEAVENVENDKQDAFSSVVVNISDDGGNPSGTGSVGEGALTLNLKNIKGRTGAQGPQGNTTILGNEEVYTLYGTVGQSADGAMTQKAVTNEFYMNPVALDPSQYSAKNTYIASNTGKYTSGNNSNFSKFIPIVNGAEKYIRLTANASHPSYYAFLTSSSWTNGYYPAYAEGCPQNRITVSANTTVIEKIPSNATWLWVLENIGSTSYQFQEITIVDSLKYFAGTVPQSLSDIESLKGKTTAIVEPLHIIYSSSSVYNTSTEKWIVSTANPTSKGGFVAVKGGEDIMIQMDSEVYTHYFFVTDRDRTAGETPHFATGYSTYVPVAAGSTVITKAPADAKYMYIYLSNSGTSRTPRLIAAVKDANEAIRNLYQEKEDKKEAEYIEIDYTNYYYGPTSGNRFLTVTNSYALDKEAIIAQVTNKWAAGSSSNLSRFIPVTPGDILKLVANDTYGTSCAFLTTNAFEVDADVSYAPNTGFIELPQGETYIFTVPEGARFFWILAKRSGLDVNPSLRWVVPIKEQVVNLSKLGPVLRPVACVEEIPDKCVDMETGELITHTTLDRYILKKYNLTAGKEYYASARLGSTLTSPAVAYYDANDVYLGGDPGFSPRDLTYMFFRQKMTVPTDAAYALIYGSQIGCPISSGVYPFPPQMYEASWTPKEDTTGIAAIYEYHNARVQTNLLTSHVDTDPTSDTKIEPTYTNSKWVVAWPNTYTVHGTPTQVIAMLHGSEGQVSQSPNVFGYSESTTNWTNWRRKYLNEGYAVIDINGTGIYASGNNTNRHYGCPVAIQTLKKAFEFLKEHYNVTSKMLIHGTSMGGCLALNYAKVYPKDVIAVAVFAPAVGMRSMALNSAKDHVSSLYGYADNAEAKADHYENAAGWAIFSKCMALQNGSLVQVDWSTIADNAAANAIDMIEHLDVPVRCWHGTADDTVDVGSSKHLIASLRRGGTQATLRLIENGTHSISSGTDPVVVEEAIDYFKRHLL